MVSSLSQCVCEDGVRPVLLQVPAEAPEPGPPEAV